MKTLQRSAAPVPDARFLPNARHLTVALVAVVVIAAVLALAIVLASERLGDSDPVRVVPSAPLPPSPAERDQPRGPVGPGHAAASARTPVGARQRVPAGSVPPVSERRLKFWGWGFEDQQPAARRRSSRLRRGAREHLGFAPAEVEPPPRLEDLELPPPRIEPPGVARAASAAAIHYERAAHAYGKSYRDVVRAFRGRFDHPPDVVAHPGDEAELEARARLVRGAPARPRSRSAAARAWWAASRRPWATASRASSRSTSSGSTACSRSTRSRRRPASRRAPPARGSRSSCASTA